ncbi:MAG: hypothetical protein P4L53_09740 [Candidatus Obscuribacterales bacterium]|nr:hypothetical protein [Candidatus Obscuribacterales bacterium]
MKFKLTGYPRYFVRELLPRTVVMLVCTCLLLPHSPGLSFHGSFGAASLIALFFTAYFWLWGAQIMGALPVRKLIAKIDNDLAMGAFYAVTVILIPLPAVILPVLVAPQIFVYTAWYGTLIWIVALNVCCLLTHDYGPA